MINKRGMSAIEILIALLVFSIVFGGVMLASRSTLRGSLLNDKVMRQAADIRIITGRLSNDLSTANMDELKILTCASSCTATDPGCDVDTDCVGKKIRFKTPIIDKTDIADSMYTPEGKLKFGAIPIGVRAVGGIGPPTNNIGRKECHYEYKVNLRNQLVRRALCPDGTTACPVDLNVSCPNASGFCGNGICDMTCPPGQGTGCGPYENCLVDCNKCGDNVCGSPIETNSNCPQDCVICGDYVCGFGETCTNCQGDCGICGTPPII